MRIFGREPTLWISVLTSVVLLLGTMSFRWISGDQAGLVIVAINAIAAAANAWTVRPISPVVFTYAVGALVAVATAYGLNIGTETVAALNVLTITVLGLLTRGQVSPQATAVSRA
jgi:hypothetical protein